MHGQTMKMTWMTWVGKEAGIMKRLLYWVKKRIMGHNKFCKHFYVTCEYYEICHIDGELS